ncbi:MAG: hypothetical protein JWM88_2666 [Verrucomicrobia bacterium]|nr:hypothetical protein [Verrucomicrobiota bacterium]
MTGVSARPELTPRPVPDSSGRLWLLLTLLVAVYFSAFAAYPGLFLLVGVNHYERWFLDTFALLASNDAVARGLDPSLPNPLDYFHRPHVYSHWWLQLRHLGLTRAADLWLGLAVVIVFLATALLRLRPRSLGQLAWYAVIVGCAPVLLAVDRANNDLAIFVILAGLVPVLRSNHRLIRLFVGPLLVALAAGLKYYPAAAALLLLAGADRKETRERMLLAGAMLVLVGFSVAPDLKGFGSLAPKPSGLLSFGAVTVFHELGWFGWLPKSVALLVAGAVAALAWRRRWLGIWQPTPAQEGDWLYFILGSVLLAGCFFTSVNFGYRWIFALWLAPLLWTLPRDPATPAVVRRWARWTARLLLLALWWDPVWCFIYNRLAPIVPGPALRQLSQACILAEQPFVWAFFLALIVFLAQFARERTRFVLG